MPAIAVGNLLWPAKAAVAGLPTEPHATTEGFQ
jgi:hypothetical protein